MFESFLLLSSVSLFFGASAVAVVIDLLFPLFSPSYYFNKTTHWHTHLVRRRLCSLLAFTSAAAALNPQFSPDGRENMYYFLSLCSILSVQ
mgnify:CR=1 FL=1